MASAECAAERPVLREIDAGHFAACLKIPTREMPVTLMPGSSAAQQLPRQDAAGMAMTR
jgi:hypothetical protein